MSFEFSMYDIITIGSATRDVFLKMEGVELRKHADSPTGVEQCFSLGSKLSIKEIVFTTGGGGTNSAVTFGRQGFKAACVGVIGNDMTGKEIIEELKKEKIEPLFQVHGDDSTAYSVILMNPNAERTILSYKGEGQHFDVKNIPFSKLKAKWFYIDSLGGHYDLFEALVNHAVKNNIKIACNPGGKELELGFEKLEPLLKHIDIFAVNKEEGAQLVGTKPEEVEETLKKLSLTCCGMVILTDGHNGSKVFAKDVFYSAGVPDSPIIERTGAGDAYNSGFVAEYMRSGDIKKAMQFATANSSSVVTKVGSKEGILKKGDWGTWPLVEVKERR
ncbi:MAG: carbohydrate kinase family protein [Candidatus Yanofskybacteria bacterium]|nr:carbohydrate kinase family protein [Candidatus Yanofskybacteria bacterium]